MSEDQGKDEPQPYSLTVKEQLILRDRLAIDRTVLANERTLLAYVRTALTLFLVGMSFVHVPMLHPDPEFGGLFYGLSGWLFVSAAVVVAAVGHVRFRRFRARVPKVADQPPPAS
jgi:putative membrane protein